MNQLEERSRAGLYYTQLFKLPPIWEENSCRENGWWRVNYEYVLCVCGRDKLD